MNSKQIKYKLILSVLLCFASHHVFAQLGYRKDSLQIKVYSEIQYKRGKLDHIKIKKVFCDYCSNNQIKAIKQNAISESFEERFNPKYYLENGFSKLTLFIRIAKKDFKAMNKTKLEQ